MVSRIMSEGNMNQGFERGMRSRMGPLARVVAMAAVFATVGLSGCAAPRQSREDLQWLTLAGLLQGHYDNSAQVEADQRAGRAPHPEVKVLITPINSLTVGDRAFYMQMTAADDPHHILEQHVFSLQAGKAGVLQAVWSLVEPTRWREGANQPELFSALQYRDIKLLAGCELVWKNDGGKFSAVNEMSRCHATPPEARGAIFERWELEVDSDVLSISERAYDAEGRLVVGREDEPFLRLRRSP